MTNELTTDLQFTVDFTPSSISILNEKELKALVDQATEYYGSLTFTDDNIPEAKEARADLNKVFKLLDDQRKVVKSQYNEPLKAFETKIKQYANQIKTVSDVINKSISDFEESEKQKRAIVLEGIIAEMAPNYELEPSDIEIKASWLNATSYTKKGDNLIKKVLEEVAGAMTMVSNERKRVASEKTVITNYAKAVHLDPESWTHMIDFGRTAPEVMREMDKVLADRKAKEEKEKEEQRNNAEYEAAMQALREQEVGDVVIDTETGEIIEPKPFAEPDEQTVRLKLTASVNKLWALNEYIKANGIQVEVIE